MKKDRLKRKRDFEVINLSGVPLNLEVYAGERIQIHVKFSPLSGTFVLNSGCGKTYRLRDNTATIFDGKNGLNLAVQLLNLSDRQLRIFLGYRHERNMPCVIIRTDPYTPLLAR